MDSNNIYMISVSYLPYATMGSGSLAAVAILETKYKDNLELEDMIKGKSTTPTHTASMAQMGAACVASAGKGIFKGTAVSMTVFPVVPDFEKYPGTGRDLNYTSGEIGLAGHWIKQLLHHGFLWKAQLKPGWTLIPE